MEIQNQKNSDDIVTIDTSVTGYVRLEIGAPNHNVRHAHLRPAEARAVAYALLSYAEQVDIRSIDCGTA